MLDSSTSCSSCKTKISRQCQKKDRNNNLTLATGCIGWSTQNGGICCEQEKDGFWEGLAKDVVRSVAASVAGTAIAG